MDYFFSEEKRRQLELQSVVALPFPCDDIGSHGFVTNRAVRSRCVATGNDLVTVFISSSPLPMTGWTINVDERRLIHLPVSVDDALRVIVSGGVIVPPEQYSATASVVDALVHRPAPPE